MHFDLKVAEKSVQCRGILTIVGYLIQKSVLYIYIKYMIFKYILLITFLNEPKVIFCTK